jgi:hypothetical protein
MRNLYLIMLCRVMVLNNYIESCIMILLAVMGWLYHDRTHHCHHWCRISSQNVLSHKENIFNLFVGFFLLQELG